MYPNTLAMFGSMFGVDGFVILVIGLLIFGKRLPEVGKNLGQTIVEFKKGLNSAGNDTAEPPAPTPTDRPAQRPENRVAASRPAKSLPSTEEV